MTTSVTPATPALSAAPSPIAAAATTTPESDAGQGERGFLRVLTEQRQSAEAASPTSAEADATSVTNAEISDETAPDTANETTDESVPTPPAAKPAKQPNAARRELGECDDDATLATGLAAVALDIAAQVAELQARRHPSTSEHAATLAPAKSVSPEVLDQRAAARPAGSSNPGDHSALALATETAEATVPTELGRAGALSATTQRFGLASPHGLRWSAQGSGNRSAAPTRAGVAAQSSVQSLTQLSGLVTARAAQLADQGDALSATALARGTGLTEAVNPLHAGDAVFGDLLARDSHGAPSDASAATASFALPDAARADPEALRVAAPALPAIAAPHWGQALGQRLVTLARQEGERHHAELRLDPPELGPLRVTLSITDGVANAAFVSPHAQVRHSVEAALEQLQASLAQAGIALGQTHVGEHDAPERDAFFAQHSSDNSASGRVESAREMSPPAVRSDALVDVYA